MTTILGIDPGKSGAIATSNGSFMKLSDATERDVWERLRSYTEDTEIHAYIEQVGPGKGEGVRSVWTFSGSYHGLRMALVASGMPWEEVLPRKWQSEFGLFGKTEQEKRIATQGEPGSRHRRQGITKAKTMKKNRHKAKAEQLFPKIKITHANADALLIATYGQRQQGRES